jgi:hypothetical protein
LFKKNIFSQRRIMLAQKTGASNGGRASYSMGKKARSLAQQTGAEKGGRTRSALRRQNGASVAQINGAIQGGETRRRNNQKFGQTPAKLMGVKAVKARRFK